MAHVRGEQVRIHVRLSAKDAASIKKLARASQLSLSDMVRTLIRRARVAGPPNQVWTKPDDGPWTVVA